MLIKSRFLDACILVFIVLSTYNPTLGLSSNGESSGSGGILLAVLMLSGGIVSVATRKSEGNGGNIALIVLFGLAAFFGFVLAGSFTDLNVWAFWCLINMILAIVALVKNK